MFQKKNKIRHQKKMLNEMKVSNLPDKEFKGVIIKLHTEVGIDDLRGDFKKEMKHI